MAVKIRLLRMGKIRNPQYRIVVADSRTKRDGRAIEFLGIYHPKEEPSLIKINSERAQYWLSVGAQPSEPVEVLLKITGDWQKFKGLPAPEPMRVAAEKVDKKSVYDSESKLAAGIAETVKVEEKAKKAAKKAEKAEKPAAEAKVEAVVETPAVEAEVKAEETPVADAAAGTDA